MSYKIKKTEVNGETIVTTVKFIFSNGEKRIIDIPHFLPKNKEEIFKSIENREESEERKIKAPSVLSLIKEEMDSISVSDIELE